MANEIKAPPSNPPVLSGPVYAIVYNASLQIWNGTAWVADTTGNRLTAQNDCALSGVFWVGSFPATILVAGTYSVIVYLQAGASPATTDTAIYQGIISWTGTAEAAGLGNVTVDAYATGMSPASQVLKNGNRIAADANGYVTVTNPVSGSVPSNQIVFDGQSFTIGNHSAVDQQFQANGIDATGWTEINFFIKNSSGDSDSAAAIAIKLRNPTAGGDGLIYQNGAPVTGGVSASDGSISSVVIVTGTSTSFTLNLTAAGAGIPAGNYVWEAAYWINAQRGPYLGTGKLTVEQSAIRSTTPL